MSDKQYDTSWVPPHYDFPIAPIDFISKNGLGWHEGNIIKYVTRYKRKKGLEDLKKARHYLDMLIADLETKEHKDDFNALDDDQKDFSLSDSSPNVSCGGFDDHQWMVTSPDSRGCAVCPAVANVVETFSIDGNYGPVTVPVAWPDFTDVDPDPEDM